MTRVITAIFVVGCLSGCKKAPENDPKHHSPGDPTSERPLKAAYFEPKSLDPGLIYDGQGRDLASNLFEGLLMTDPKGNVVMGQAQSQSTSKDGLTWTFKLRPGLRWSDNTPIKASDFVWSLQRAVSKSLANPRVNQLWPLKNAKAISKGDKPSETLGVRAPDDRTVVVELERPYPLLPNLLATVYAAPVPRHTVTKFGKKWTRPENFVGNGPYVLTSHKNEEKMVMSKNPAYWDASNVSITQVIYRFTSNMQTGHQWYTLGEVDWSWGLIPPDIVTKLKKERSKDLKISLYDGYLYLLFNTRKAPLNNPTLRKALDLGLDRVKLTRQVIANGEQPGTTIVPLGMTTARPPQRVRFDPAKAKALLAEAGYGKGTAFPQLELVFNTNEKNKRLAEFFQRNLKENLGIEITLANVEWKTFLDKFQSGDFMMAQLVLGGGYDPLDYLQMLETNAPDNRVGWSHPEYDDLLKAATAATTTEARDKEIEKALAIIDAQAPILPIYRLTRAALVRPELKGYESNPENFHPVRWMSWTQ